MALKLRDHALHWPAGDKLDDDKADKKYSEDRWNHQKKAVEDIIKHVRRIATLSFLRKRESLYFETVYRLGGRAVRAGY